MDNKNVINKSMNRRIEIYRKRIVEDSLSSTYKFLLSYMSSLQKSFKIEMSESFSTKNLLNGYLDFSYFYFINEFLISRKLKMGIVFNHLDLTFELWLMGSTKESQIYYWDRLSNSRLNTNKAMPEWYVLSVILVIDPDFDKLNKLTSDILELVPKVYAEIEEEIVSFE